MRIESYFRQIENHIEDCPVDQISNVTYEKRGSHEGFVRGELHFVDGSVLHLREFVDVEITADRLMSKVMRLKRKLLDEKVGVKCVMRRGLNADDGGWTAVIGE